MASLQLQCGNCQTWWSPEVAQQVSRLACPNCSALTQIAVFPALTRKNPDTAPKTTTGEQSTCFFHATKVAERACDQCGRFMCGLCDIHLENHHLCPNCLEKNLERGDVQQFDKEFTYYDTIAFGFALVSVILVYLGVVTASISLFITLRYWKKPVSMAPRGKWRYVASAILATLILSLWAGSLIVALVQNT